MRPDRQNRPDRRDDRPFRREKYQDRPRVPLPPQEFLFTQVREIAAERGFEVLDLSLSSGGTFRAVIDQDVPGGPGSEDLTRFIYELRDRIRLAGHEPGDLRMELDTPGERRLLTTPRHFERFAGRRVRVFFRVPQDGKDHRVGKLLGAEGERPRVEDGDGVVTALDPTVVKAIHLEP
jgi:ribosome maturation factor RimP